MRKYSNSSK